jgi:hypothetical protein
MVVGEEQQAEPDLRDEHRLREGDQMRHDPARLSPAPVCVAGERRGTPRRSKDEECNRVVRR